MNSRQCLCLAVLLGAAVAAKIPTCLDPEISSYPYCDKSLSTEQRVADLMGRMTQQEKLALTHGVSVYPYIGYIRGNSRLGIPVIALEDGPQGVADLARKVTCFPSALAVTTTWDRDLFKLFGQSTATEQRNKGSMVMLGPMSNIARVPRGGRNFEGAGEDPYMAGVFASTMVQAIQSQGILACSKHFVANNQEANRGSVSAEIDERTLWEMYYSHFQAAVEAGVGTVMCSYNKINGTHGCQNTKTLSDLKDRMGFKGWVMSDWMATHARADSANAGLDMEMPFGLYFGSLGKAIEAGEVPQSRLEDMVGRILRTILGAGFFDHAVTGTITSEARTPETRQASVDLARASVTLLRNDRSLLPLSAPRSVAVIGSDADNSKLVRDLGSGGVWAENVITSIVGIRARAGNETVVTFYDGTKADAAAKAAAEADVAVVVAGCSSAEGADRKGLGLSSANDKMIEAVLRAQPNTVVALIGPGAITMPWEGLASTIVMQFTPGQDAGTALAEALWGDSDTRGRLPLTFPHSEEETWLQSEEQYPGVKKVEQYSEGLLVGYRWYDHTAAKPLFAFGHGLSYTQFQYSAIKATDREVSAIVTNVGKRDGYEVAQLYVSFPVQAQEPPKVLRGFEKVFLRSGESATVKFPLTERDLSIYDVEKEAWTPFRGTFTAQVGASSVDIRLSAKFEH